jgi:Tfp pilus assembly protein PilN
MIERLQSYWLYGSTFCSLELTSQNEEEVIYGLTAKKKKNEFDNIKTFQSSIDTISDNLSKNQHCYLTVNTDQVLIETATNFKEDNDIVAQAFPGLSSTSFYSEILKQGKIAFVAVCRKEYIDKKIKELENKGISIIGFSLGFSVVKNTLSLLNKDSLQTSRQELTLGENSIVDYDSIENSQKEDYKIEDVTINANHLLSLSGLPNYFAENQQELTTKHKQKTFFQKGLYAGVGLLIGVWIINMIFFTTYKGELKELRGQSSTSLTQKEAYQAKLKEVNQKEKVVQNILQTANSKSAFYLNRVTASLPETINLSQLAYQPIAKAIREGKEINYQENVLVVSGISTDTQVFNSWIEQLEKFSWIASSTVSSYTQKTNSKAEFEIKFNLAYDTTN